MTTALIDGDIVAYRCAAVADKEAPHDPITKAISLADNWIAKIAVDLNATDVKIFLTGPTNFRKDVYPEYKQNRVGKPRPTAINDVHFFLSGVLGAEISENMEADDLLSINQTENTIICSIDKDLLQVPGKHYNIVSKTFSEVSQIEGLRTLYMQLIKGDQSDNVPAFDGKFRSQTPQFVQKHLDPLLAMTNEYDMWLHCISVYHDFGVYDTLDVLSTMIRNMRCLYLLKHKGDEWKPPKNPGLPDE
jgi:5'-3' exonuclease